MKGGGKRGIVNNLIQSNYKQASKKLLLQKCVLNPNRLDIFIFNPGWNTMTGKLLKRGRTFFFYLESNFVENGYERYVGRMIWLGLKG